MSRASPLHVRAYTGDFDDTSNMSSQFSPLSGSGPTAWHNKAKPLLKRAQTGGVPPSAKKGAMRAKSAVPTKPLDAVTEFQQEMAISRGIKDISRFKNKLLPKRSLLGNAAAVKADKAKRMARNKALVADRLEVKREQLKAKQAGKDYLESTDDESVVVEADIIHPEHKWTPFSTILAFDKTHTSKETIPSPFCSSRYRRKVGYGTQLFFDELNDDQLKVASAVAGGESAGGNSSRKESDISSESSTSSDEEGCGNSSVRITRTASLKFVDDMFSVRQVIGMQLDVSVDEDDEDYDEDVYDGVPKESNYFGVKARSAFFGLYNKMAQQGQSGAIEESDKGIDKKKKKRDKDKPPSPHSRPNSPFSRPSSRGDSRPQSGNRGGRRQAGRLTMSHLNSLPGANRVGGTTTALPAIDTRMDADFDDDDDFIFDSSDDEDDDEDEDKDKKMAIPKYSPRHRFLQLLVKERKVAPLPIIIRRSPDDDELNLAHRSLGDDYIIYLSQVVQDLPNLTKVNLRDNRLTDRGMGKFIHTLASQQQITSVDISENKIDSKSAEALTHFLKRTDCSLSTLKMSNADLDDDEVAIFMDALEVNQSITEMDVSHNKLGGIGEKSVKKKGNELVGGASIAAAIAKNTTLHILNLSWNKLGFATAVQLETAIFHNKTLLDLNLAYNTIRDEGAECIGSALMANGALTHLDLSHNGIGSLGAFVVATGLRLSGHIQILNISGNPIGSHGCMSLLQTLNYHCVQREILMHECSFDEQGFGGHGMSTAKVNMIYPTGKYSLDLSKPRFRCMLIELYRLASVRRGYLFRNIEYKGVSQKGMAKKVPIRLKRSQNPACWRGQPYGPWKQSDPRGPHPYTQMEADEWMKVEYELFLLDESTGMRWDVPSVGTLSFDFSFVPRCACPIDCVNATGLRRLVAILNSHPKECLNILKTCRHVMLESHQVDTIMNSFDDSVKVKDKIEILSYLLLCVRDTSNTCNLFPHHLRILNSMKEIYQVMRSMLYVATNAFTGHFSLDLDNPLDRLAAIRLMEISADEQAYIQRAMPSWGASPSHGFTSQKQNRSNFRNEKYQRMVLDKGCSDDFFAMGLEDKNRGVLEFDFVSTSRPVQGADPIADHFLDFILNNRGLKNAAKVATQALKMSRRRTVKMSIDGFDTAANPFCIDETMAPTSNQTSQYSAAPTLSLTSEVMYTPPNKQLSLQPIFDPSVVLGHYVIDMGFVLEAPERPTTIDDLYLHLREGEYDFVDNLRRDDLTVMVNDVNTGQALYVAKTSLERYTVNLCIRILNYSSDCIFEAISFIKKQDGGYDAFGHAKAEASDKPTSTAAIMDLLGLSGENARYEIGVLQTAHAATLNPTHRKFVINDEMYLMGSDIYCKLKCEDWTEDGIAVRAKEACVRLFSCIGVTTHTVRVVNQRTADAKSSEFLSHKFSEGIVDHIVLQQVDVCVAGIPQDQNLLLKAYVNSGKGASVDDASAVINTLWRWRARTSQDRGSPKIDLLTYPYEFWGFKFLMLRTMIGSFWITCEQAARIVLEFPLYGYDAQPHRESAIVCVFSRLVDPENIEIVMDTVPQISHAGIYRRLGWLNVLNAWDVDKLFSIDLSYDDARLVAIMLSKFAAVEPGDNFLGPRFRRSLADLFIPGWDLPASWTIDPDKAKAWDGVPRKGEVLVEYSSSPDTGCRMVPSIRKHFFERYTLLAVPRGNGDDFYIADEMVDWDS